MSKKDFLRRAAMVFCFCDANEYTKNEDVQR
jgi:hypothetical protein